MMRRGMLGLVLLAGCAAQRMEHYAPAHCHGASQSFDTYTVRQVDMPGFIQGVLEQSLDGSLARLGLRRDEHGDVLVQLTFEQIDRNPPPRAHDPFGEPVMTSEVNRFVAHVEVDIFDTRTDDLIWTGSMSRAHAIRGGETFHSDRAVLIVSRTLDAMFQGLTKACE